MKVKVPNLTAKEINHSSSSSEKWGKGLPKEEVLDEPKLTKGPKLSQRESEMSL